MKWVSMGTSGSAHVEWKRTCRGLRFLGARTGGETCWPIEGAGSPRTKAVSAECVANAIIDSRVSGGDFSERGKETIREAGVLIVLLRIEAAGLQCPGSYEVPEGSGRVLGKRMLLDHVVEAGY